MRGWGIISLFCLSMLANASSNTKETQEPMVADGPSGQTIYEQHCMVCHQDGVAGAPKFRAEADWKPRLDKKNLDELTVSAIKGINAMPAKGTCPECSDTDINAAIKYMVPQP